MTGPGDFFTPSDRRDHNLKSSYDSFCAAKVSGPEEMEAGLVRCVMIRATPVMMVALANSTRPVTTSLPNAQPRKTATAGFTNA